MATIAELKAIAHTPARDLDGPSFCQYDTDACPACGRLRGPCDLPYGPNLMARIAKALRERGDSGQK